MQDEGVSAPGQRSAHDVPGRPRLVIDDGPVLLEHRVEQRTLARVGGTHEDDLHPVPQESSRRRHRQERRDPRGRLPQDPQRGLRRNPDLLVLAEFEGPFDLRQEPQQRTFDPAHLRVQASEQLADRGPGHQIVLGVDQVGHGLGLIQAEPAVHEGAPGEFPGGGRDGSRGQAGPDDRPGDHTAPVTEEFNRVLSGIGMGGQHWQGQNLVDDAFFF